FAAARLSLHCRVKPEYREGQETTTWLMVDGCELIISVGAAGKTRAMLSLKPAEMAITGPRLLGTMLSPYSLLPQATIVPSDLSATLWSPPAAIATTLLKPT